MRDVARAASVSVCTASHALRGIGRVSDTTRDVVRKAAADIGYTNDPFLAGALSRARRRSARQSGGGIGVLLATQPPGVLGTAEGRACLEGIKECAEAYGYVIDTFFPDRDYTEDPDRLHAVIRARGLDGLIFIENVHSIYLGALTSQLIFEGKEELPVVFAGRSEIPETSAWHVGFDRFASGFACMEYALETGSRRPGVVTSIGRISVNDEFAAGCRKAQERFLPAENIPSVFVMDSADSARHELLAAWSEKENIDRIITNSRVVKFPENEQPFRLAGIPVVHGEMRSDLSQQMPGVIVDWKDIGALATEALFSRLQQSNLTRLVRGSRLLAPGCLRRLDLGPREDRDRWQALHLTSRLNGQVNTPGDWFGPFPLPLRGEDALHGARAPFLLSKRSGSGWIGACYLRSKMKVGGMPPAKRPSKVVMKVPESERTIRAFHFLLGAGFAEAGAQAGQIEIRSEDETVIGKVTLIAGGRPQAVRGANIQDWWPHYPLLENAVPVYHPKDRAYHGYLYQFEITIPTGAKPTHWVIRSNPKTTTSLALLAVLMEF